MMDSPHGLVVKNSITNNPEKRVIMKYENTPIHYSYNSDNYCEYQKTKYTEIQETIEIDIDNDFFIVGSGSYYTDITVHSKSCNRDLTLGIYYRVKIDYFNVYGQEFSIEECKPLGKTCITNIREGVAHIKKRLKLYIRYYICPVCGRNIYAESSSIDTMNYVTKKLGIYVFNNQGGTYKYSTIYKMVGVFNGKIHIMQYKDIAVFNRDTYKLYNISHKHICGSNALKNIYKQKISNITLSPYLESLGVDILDDILEYIECTNGRKPDIWNDAIDDTRSYEIKMNKYRFYYMQKYYNFQNGYIIQLLLLVRGYDKALFYKYIHKSEKEVLKLLKLPRKALHEKGFFRNFNICKYLLALPFITDNNQYKMFLKQGSSGFRAKDVKSLRRIIKEYAKVNGNKRCLNQIAKASDLMLSDICYMHKQVITEIPDYKLDCSGTLERMHDSLARVCNRLNTENRETPSDEFLNNVVNNMTVGNITYHMVKETQELITTGEIMDICVASYRNEVLEQRSFIAVGLDEKEKPVTCIELKRKGKQYELMQAKKHHNTFPGIEESNYIRNTMIENNIKINTNDLNMKGK